MEGLQSIMQQLQERTGIKAVNTNMSEKEYVEEKCRQYNALDGNLPDYDCDKCKNKGYIAIPEYNDMFGYWGETHKACDCQKTRNAIKRLEQSGLKDIVKKCTFEKYIAEHEWQQHLKNKAIEYAKNPDGKWLYMGGNSGSGKTHLCTAVARMFLLKGKNVRYMVWMDESKKLKAIINDAESYNEQISAIKNADVLYIDDLFKTGKDQNGNVMPPTAADVQLAIEILNYRYYNHCYATIISSERLLNEITDIDEALGGRIAEMTGDCKYAINIARDKSKNYRLRNLTTL